MTSEKPHESALDLLIESASTVAESCADALLAAVFQVLILEHPGRPATLLESRTVAEQYLSLVIEKTIREGGRA